LIKIDIKIGDTILVGKWKNKKVEVKKIGTDEFGSPTVNGKSILKIRIPKLYKEHKEHSMKLKDLLTEGTTVDEKSFLNFVDKLKQTRLRANIKYVPSAKPPRNAFIIVSLGWDYPDESADKVEMVANKLGLDLNTVEINATSSGEKYTKRIKINGGVKEY
jgi:hypothetical protein